jgi:uncharacterized protein (TIGR02147 family)
MNSIAQLRQTFLEKKRKNPAYSTRAFARDLGMSQSLLSMVLNGKRPLTLKQSSRIASLLNLGSEEFIDYDAERFKAISHWYHFGILDLTTTDRFKNDSAWMAKRLGISKLEIEDAVERLVRLGLLERSGRTLKKANSKVYLATSKSESAVRSFHRQMISKALEELDKTTEKAFNAREISSMTIAVPKSEVPRAKLRIKQFQKDLAAMLNKAGPCNEVYQLNVQFFSLTKETE